MHKNSSISITSIRLSLSISYHFPVKSNQWRILMFGNNPSCPQWIYPVFHAVQVKYDIRDQFDHYWTIRRVWAAAGSNHGADHYLPWVPSNISETGTRLIVESCRRELVRASPSLHPPSTVSRSSEWIIAPESLVLCVLMPIYVPCGCCVDLNGAVNETEDLLRYLQGWVPNEWNS